MVTDNDTITGIYRAIVCDGKPIGSISVEKKDDDAEIGYMLHNDYSNKGIGTGKAARVWPPRVSCVEPVGRNKVDPLRRNKNDPWKADVFQGLFPDFGGFNISEG